MLYPNEVWEQKTKQIDQLNIYSTKQRQAIRFFYRGATELTMDSSERINLPASLMEYAGITQDVMLFAYQNHIEVWSKESYAASLDIESVDFDAIADVLGNLG
jgi:MraZ protein